MELEKFDMQKMKTDAIVLLIGKRRTGKSVLTTDILYNHRHKFPICIVMSGTEESNEHYKEMIPEWFIYSDFDSKAIQQILQRQKDVINSNKEKLSKILRRDTYEDMQNRRVFKILKHISKRYDISLKRLVKDYLPGVDKSRLKKPPNYSQSVLQQYCEDPSLFLLLDDCIYDENTLKKDIGLKYIYSNGRHLKLCFLVTSQSPMALSPFQRNNCDYVFVFKENIMENRKKLHKHYFGCFPSFKVFEAVFDQCTQNYECLVLDNTTSSTKLQDCVFWYKAELHDTFRTCAPEMWERPHLPEVEECRPLTPPPEEKKSYSRTKKKDMKVVKKS
uniref:Uncharacterized protein n=1 Tax=viral metagenome TaxID=1070528 RepID=A0A6C0CMY7_9ZZZZ